MWTTACSLRTRLSWSELGLQSRGVLPKQAGVCWRCGCRNVARKAVGEKGVLQGVAPENEREVAKVLEKAQRHGGVQWMNQYTDFLSPSAAADASMVLQRCPGLPKGIHWGGYPQAERVRIAFVRDELVEAATHEPSEVCTSKVALNALRVAGNFVFEAAMHRDFLGAALGTGVTRSVLGDVLVQGETGAHLLVVPEIVEHMEAALLQVRSVSVTARLMDLADLGVREVRVEELKTVEASLRMDAVGSAGFRISRAKFADMLKGGDVRRNWKTVKPTAVIGEGDIISARGLGRLEVRGISRTKKGKYVVELLRHV